MFPNSSRPFLSFLVFAVLAAVLVASPVRAQSPVLAWAEILGTQVSGSDNARGSVVDAAGNVYVTGWMESSANNEEYRTVKLNPAGQVLWTARYTEWSSGDHRAEAIAVDASGNVYVTGAGEAYSSGYDYATVKYDASGNELWVARYNSGGGADDRAVALAVDDGGNVYVTGYSPGDLSAPDYVTVKYGPNGGQL